MKVQNIILISFQLLFRPFINRLKLGEGGLVAFNLISALFSQKEALNIGIETLFSFWVMCVLYGFNDYKDVEKDSLNPKKEKDFIKVIVENKNLFFWLINGMYFLTISFSLFFFNIATAFVLVALYFVNLTYSKFAKAIPILDIVAVVLWGCLITMLVNLDHILLNLSAGAMTGIAHVYQMVVDKDVDASTRTNTTIVAIKNSDRIGIAVLCVLLGYCVYSIGSKWVSLFAVIPVLIFFTPTSDTKRWQMSRVFFGLCWIYLLYSVYYGK